MSFIDREIFDYSERMTSNSDKILNNLERETYLRTVNGSMVSGFYQGRVLSMISKMIRPKNILEIGTFTGYSALCLAEGLVDGGVLHTIEVEEENESIIRKYFGLHPLGERIELHIGDAMEVIPNLDLTWDLVFIDANKQKYLDFYKMLQPKLSIGGVILIDNVLWFGNVIKENKDNDAKVIDELNEYVNNDPMVENLILPIRDGISIIRKL